jgi:hypothetical protein
MQLPFEAAPGSRSPSTCTPANHVRPLPMKARTSVVLRRTLAGCSVHMWMGRLSAAWPRPQTAGYLRAALAVASL